MRNNFMPTILMVSFGTVNSETRKKSIDAVAQTLQQAYPQFELRQAFTSSMVIHRLAQQNIFIDDVPTALEKLKQQGCQQLYVLPTHLFAAEEYQKLLTMLQPYKKDFQLLSVAPPLLHCDADWLTVVSILQKTYPLNPQEALVLMAHGSEQDLSERYKAMSTQLKNHSCGSYFLASMKGEPSLDKLLVELKQLSISRIKLLPLMLSAGAHAVKDMAGSQQNSWKSRCLAAGFQVDCLLYGLAEIPEIRQLYLQHLQQIINS